MIPNKTKEATQNKKSLRIAIFVLTFVKGKS